MPVPDRQRADEALDWVRRIHDPSFADWAAHVDWLEADPANARAFDEASATIAAATAALAPPERFVAPPIAGNDNPPDPARVHPRWWRWAPPIGVAAAAGIVALVAVPRVVPGPAASYLVRTAAGQQRSIAIDGTTIVLNGGSRLRLDRDDARLATLEAGEALFAVRHDAAHPFGVRVGGALFRDVGTVFDVVARAGTTRVAVRDGAVLYDPDGAAVRLAAGQSIRLAAGTATVRPIDAVAVGGWRTGRLSYRDAPLSDVADDVARSIGEPVAVDPALSTRRFSGVVQIDADRPRMFRRLAAVMGVGIRRARRGWQVVTPDR